MTRRRALVLYSKPGCHLCDDLRGLLEELREELGLTIDEIDITADAALFARYRYEIPVLLMDGRQVVRGRVGEAELLEALGETPRNR